MGEKNFSRDMKTFTENANEENFLMRQGRLLSSQNEGIASDCKKGTTVEKYLIYEKKST